MFLFQLAEKSAASALTEPQAKKNLDAIAKGDLSVLKLDRLKELEKGLSALGNAPEDNKKRNAISAEIEAIRQNALNYFKYASTLNVEAAIVIVDKFWETIKTSYEIRGDADIVRAWNSLSGHGLTAEVRQKLSATNSLSEQVTAQGRQELIATIVDVMHWSPGAAEDKVDKLLSGELTLAQMADAGAGEQVRKVAEKMEAIKIGSLGGYFRTKVYDKIVNMSNLPDFALDVVNQMDAYFKDAFKRANMPAQYSVAEDASAMLKMQKWGKYAGQAALQLPYNFVGKAIDAVTLIPFTAAYNIEQIFTQQKFGLVNPPYGTMIDDISKGIAKSIYDPEAKDTWKSVPWNVAGGAFMLIANLTSLPSWMNYWEAKRKAYSPEGFTPNNLELASLNYNIALIDTAFLLAIGAGTAIKMTAKASTELVFLRAKYQLILHELKAGKPLAQAQRFGEEQIMGIRNGLDVAKATANQGMWPKGISPGKVNDWWQYREQFKPFKEGMEAGLPQSRREMARYISDKIFENSGVRMTVQVPTLGTTITDGAKDVVKKSWKGMKRMTGKGAYAIEEKAGQYAEILKAGKIADRAAVHGNRILLGKKGTNYDPIFSAIENMKAAEAGLPQTSRITFRELRQALAASRREMFGKTSGQATREDVKKARAEKLQAKMERDELKIRTEQKKIAEEMNALNEKILKSPNQARINELTAKLRELEEKLASLGKAPEEGAKIKIEAEITTLKSTIAAEEKARGLTPDGKKLSRLGRTNQKYADAIASVDKFKVASEIGFWENVYTYTKQTLKTLVRKGALPPGSPEWMTKMADYMKKANLLKKYKDLAKELAKVSPEVIRADSAYRDALGKFSEAFCATKGINSYKLTPNQAKTIREAFFKEKIAQSKAGDAVATQILKDVDAYEKMSLLEAKYKLEQRLIIGTAMVGIGTFLYEKYKDEGSPGKIALKMMADAGEGAVYAVGGAFVVGEGALELMVLSRMAPMLVSNPAFWLIPLDPALENLSYAAATQINESFQPLSTRVARNLFLWTKTDEQSEFRDYEPFATQPFLKNEEGNRGKIYLSIKKDFLDKYPNAVFMVYDNAGQDGISSDMPVAVAKNKNGGEIYKSSPGQNPITVLDAARAYKVVPYFEKLGTEGKAVRCTTFVEKKSIPALLPDTTQKKDTSTVVIKNEIGTGGQSTGAAKDSSDKKIPDLSEQQKKLAGKIKTVVDDLPNLVADEPTMKSYADKITQGLKRARDAGKTNEEVYSEMAGKMIVDGLNLDHPRGTQVSRVISYLKSLGYVDQ